jgi:hypothetical protein
MARHTQPLVGGETAKPVSALAPNAFIGKAARPTDAELGQALGSAKPVWDRLIADLAAEHEVATQEWNSYSLKAGWALRLLRGKRTIVWMSPLEGCFRVAFILGDKAVAAARQSRLPARVLQLIDQALKYPEGTGLRMEIRGPKDIPAVKKLAVIKLEN